jgi:glycosyltransferase involved in cell wall biosynthesis
MSADRFLGEPKQGWEILYNPVDTKIFTPVASNPDSQHLVLLVSGSHNQFYRIETALRTVALLMKQRKDVRLLIAGRFNWASDDDEALHQVRQLLSELNVCKHVQLLGAYTQQEAPTLLQKAHILLHTKYNDVCPGLVLEAMACGLPVVYSYSGGVPELVGENAGIGIPAVLSWEQAFPPEPELLAEAVLQVAERRAEFAETARQRAVEKFDLQPWLQRHQDVFEELLST